MGDTPVYDVATGKPMYSSVSGKPTLTCSVDCPTDCTLCGDTFTVNFTDRHGNVTTYPLARVGEVDGSCVWNWEGTLVNLNCSGGQWSLVLYDRDTLTDEYRWTAPASSCPPTTLGAWTPVVTNPPYAGTLNSMSLA